MAFPFCPVSFQTFPLRNIDTLYTGYSVERKIHTFQHKRLNASTLGCWMAEHLSDSLFLSWVLSFRSGSGERVWSPTVSEDGKTSPYMEPDSQVNTVYFGFIKTQVTMVASHLYSPPLGCYQNPSAFFVLSFSARMKTC